MPERLAAGDPARGRRAVVIGGSVAGLVAARVLADHFDEVIVIERDRIADDLVTPRKGVPQGRHLHALLARGGQSLGRMFPGFVDDAVADGALVLDFGRDFAWYQFGGFKARVTSGVDVLCISRPLLEAHVRRRVFALPKVRRLDARDVTGLLASPDRMRLTGVAVAARDGDREAEAIAADLVVDASGRGSKLPAWLEGLGFPPPPETQIHVQVGYASRSYRLLAPERVGWKALYVLGDPPAGRRLGALFPVEGGRGIVVLAGLLGDYAPDDPAGFLEFARSLPVDAMHRFLLAAEPLSDIATYRFPAHRLRHYERMASLPEGLAVVGDALASFNPVYGQGMTTACLEAEVLGQCLEAHRARRGPGWLDGLSRRYHAAAAKVAGTPWLLSTGEDFRYPEVKGDRPPYYPVLSWYTGLVHRAARVDTRVYKQFLRVMHMLDGPGCLFDPRVAGRVLRGAGAAPSPRGPKPLFR